MGVEAYSTNPNANGSQMPEGQAPSTVNDGVRTIQAHMAAWYNDPQWYRPGAPAPTITRLSINSIRIAGFNVTDLYIAGRKVRVQGASTGTIYGLISAVAYTGGNTDVTLTLDSGTIESEDLVVSLAVAGPAASLPIASPILQGIIQLLNSEEYQAGSNPSKAVTVDLITEGWTVDTTPGLERILVRLPLGIKIEFGHNVSSGDVEFLTPYAFPPVVLVTVNPPDGVGVNEYGAASGITATRCGVHAFTSSGTQTGSTVGYMAIGV